MSNKHIQTIYSSLFRKLPNIKFEIEQFILSDGDFLECYWLKTDKHNTNTPIVILFHGLAGSYKSPYIQGAMQKLKQNGFSSVVMHFRGCSGKDNVLPRSYHSGDSNDAKEYIKDIHKNNPNSKLYAVGYSLGANMLLKLLGENVNSLPIEKAVAISAPMLLDVCADAMNKGFARYYQKWLLKDLHIALDKKYDKHDMRKLLHIKRQDIKNLKSFWKFDEAYTAPIHGFLSAKDYYTKCSSRQFLKNITIPTLIIHSKDDPFMTQKVIPKQNELSSSITLELTHKGGHVGFIGGSFFRPEYWLETKIVNYLL